MPNYTFHLVNVFAENTLDGNPLCVFEDARGMSDAQMQALALQINLSETTFLFPCDEATRHMRIFTPRYEMGFAGHPTLGSAHIVRTLVQADAITLKTQVGNVPVHASGDRWQFQVPQRAQVRPSGVKDAQIAEALGIETKDFAGAPMYVNTGNEQFLVPLVSREAVMRVNPNADLLRASVRTITDRYMSYVFAMESNTQVVSRFFFAAATGMAEDPGTGSACANLGGYLLHTAQGAPRTLTIDQGERTGRRCALSLTIDAQENVFVGGRCVRLGGGLISI